MGVFDVPAWDLIQAIAKDLQGEFKVQKPVWTDFVKTGMHRERAPDRDDWYFIRIGSLLYRVCKDQPLGVGSLRTYYGGRKHRGVKKEKFRKSSGKIIRLGLQELEKLGLIKKEKKGRVITSKGQSYLNKRSKEVFEIVKKRDEEFAAQEALRREKAKQARTVEQKPLEQKSLAQKAGQRFEQKGIKYEQKIGQKPEYKPEQKPIEQKFEQKSEHSAGHKPVPNPVEKDVKK